MPKHEVGTPKYIANKIKAKGLQKLRWYCQMCQKQCRDENGFKCHTTSESHQRQLLLFADNPHKYIDQFSDEFQDTFTELLRRRFGTRRVQANVVYQEYISDRDHLHMNATQWETLTSFVKWLGRTGKCVVDETEKGYYITYIDRDPETIERQKALAKKEKMDKDDEEKMMKFIEKQVERGKQTGAVKESVFTELKKDPDSKLSLQIALKPGAAPTTSKPLAQPSAFNTFKKPDAFKPLKKEKEVKMEKRKASALEEIMTEQEKQKEKANRKDNWITENIIVKVVTKALGDKYYKQKGAILKTENEYTAVVKMIETGHTLKLDQTHLETVIPALGKKVKIVNGAYRGCVANLLSLDEKNFSVKIEIDEGAVRGRVLNGISYDDISKLHTPS